VLISIVMQDQSILENDTISQRVGRLPILSDYDPKKREKLTSTNPIRV
jgi:hypothetical protein